MLRGMLRVRHDNYQLKSGGAKQDPLPKQVECQRRQPLGVSDDDLCKRVIAYPCQQLSLQTVASSTFSSEWEIKVSFQDEYRLIICLS